MNGDRDMKSLGWVVLVLGVIWALVAINMDVSVATGYGGRVNNIGLMASKQNHIIIGAFIVLCGLLMVIFGRRKTEEVGLNVKCPFCAEFIKADAIKCKHCGSDVSERLERMRKDNFSPTDMSYELFFIRRKNGFEINSESVRVLAERIKESSPGSDYDELLLKHKEGINTIKNQLPSGVRDEFESAINSQLR